MACAPTVGVLLASLKRLLIPCVAALLGACTSLPMIDRATISTEAIAISPDTALGKLAQQAAPDEDSSGFRLMPLGPFSLDTRVELARRAQVSLDVQYYHFEADETGRWLIRALRDAALRGVRVRLLLDDLYTGGHDTLFLAFAAHPNVEVRLFNPFLRARDSGPLVRLLASLDEFSRVNHRMHNKLFIADGAMAVIGGRNVANDYFLRAQTQNFVDMDAFTVGFVVSPLQFLFDRYWNSEAVYPLRSIVKSELGADALRAWFDTATGAQTTPPPPSGPDTDVLGYGPIREDLDAGRLDLIWGDARVFADHPDKPFDDEPGGALSQTSVAYNLFETLRDAKSSVVLSSPYFVPGPDSMALLKTLRDRGVKIIVLTNSLASTDEPIVHVGYSRYREALLQMGVDLYEMSSSLLMRNTRHYVFGKSLGRLHAKLAVIDGEQVFIGSMNLDPRSATINTELGSLAKSRRLASEMRNVIDIDRLQNAYRVRLNPQGLCCEWLGSDGEKEIVLTEEPDSGPWQRLKNWLLRPFVPDAHL